MEFETIRKIIAEKMDIEEDSISEDSSLQDLEIDSLDMVDIIMSIEEEMGVSLEELTDVKKVSDVVDYVKNLKS